MTSIRKKKLLIVTTVPETLSSILKGQPKKLSKNFEVSIVSSGSPLLSSVQRYEGVNCHSVNMKRGISPFMDLLSLIKMFFTIYKIKPDIVHSYTPKAGLIAMLASFINRTPVRIHTFTGLIFPTENGIKKRILIYIDRLICNCATNIVPEGLGVKNDLLSFRITTKQLELIGNGNVAGVDTCYFSMNKVEEKSLLLRKKLNIPNSAFVFCFVGRFTPDKGFDELLEAFSQLPNRAHLLLVGALDERLPLGENTLMHLSNHPRIFQTGWLDDIRPALGLSDILVLPSYREGFPNAPLQAGSMQLPCIVSNVNGCNEIIQDGVNGWLVDAKSSSRLTKAMFDGMSCSRLEIMGKTARENIVMKFQRDFYLTKLNNFYFRLSNNIH
ncbi:glycosyltransferase family 4 protein [Vibrio coralliirubri]|uniref:glycosyltransferase family 4 protein n=1 Tax=Vibrio coralliirubri TaxID=1516159 RepID=UPI000635F95F|nr:glycosyltransferase family 4 protein [Vibrio coralliirubri]CDU01204.1 putative glycosyl transferase, group 1 [Vibrio coralliirubri]